MEPTTCVRRTQDSFGRRRGLMLIFAKFVPGLATLAPPVAGQNGMAFGPFLLFDAIGGTLWVEFCSPSAAFSATCSSAIQPAHWAGRFSGALLVLGILAFFLGRVCRRRWCWQSWLLPAWNPKSSRQSSMPAKRSLSSICAIRSSCCPIHSPCPARCTSLQKPSPSATTRSARPRHRALLHLPQRGHGSQDGHDPPQAGNRARAALAWRLRRMEAPRLPAGSDPAARGGNSAREIKAHAPPRTNSAAMLVPIGEPTPLHGSGPTAAS